MRRLFALFVVLASAGFEFIRLERLRPHGGGLRRLSILGSPDQGPSRRTYPPESAVWDLEEAAAFRSFSAPEKHDVFHDRRDVARSNSR